MGDGETTAAAADPRAAGPAPPRVVLKPRRARPFFARHPWVFAGSIQRVEGEVGPGAEVAVVSSEGQFVARGLFNPQGAIRVRLYRWEDAPLDEPFWRGRLETALRLRTGVLGLDAPGGSYRAVFSEADGLSGLAVDRYDRWLVAQITSLALFERRDLLLRLLAELTGAEGIAVRTERGIAEQEGLRIPEGLGLGTLPEGPIELVEHGITYLVDLRAGQKTGFYLDQRDNRRAVAAYARGRRVLDLFCYTGGFGLNALHGGAEHVLGIDSSAPAIELARRNAVANGMARARFEVADVFDALERLRASGPDFGLVILDPPKFARHPKAVEDAMKAYLRLNRAAVDVLAPDGVLVTCSCSGHVDRELFAAMLAQVAELSGRPIQILERRGQGADHPVAASCLETEYLKCFICRVA
jgi:23S rRNA (cytosine1962-C5)-methyltransferase